MTITAKKADGGTIRVSQIWAWILAVFALPAITAGVAVYAQGAVFGEKIAAIERQQIKTEAHEDRVDERLRAIESQLSRVLAKLESIR